jgi:hypothetical protein
MLSTACFLLSSMDKKAASSWLKVACDIYLGPSFKELLKMPAFFSINKNLIVNSSVKTEPLVRYAACTVDSHADFAILPQILANFLREATAQWFCVTDGRPEELGDEGIAELSHHFPKTDITLRSFVDYLSSNQGSYFHKFGSPESIEERLSKFSFGASSPAYFADPRKKAREWFFTSKDYSDVGWKSVYILHALKAFQNSRNLKDIALITPGYLSSILHAKGAYKLHRFRWTATIYQAVSAVSCFCH